ncbi:50S ribosomal protein L3 N(5)-glutamine methyltransferase [Blochmannia endosymbiont of Camponotus sp. C-003]|uniref:50S ribosomal protein L3 N(5)-glutamine methyltransferase n=1 Tax=unclassified Candidatus Blochmanniella TaxID=711328 RepID=UPI0020258988|nr:MULTISPECIES: 50S ribosomal protein L3 N(5)-glutamine methyltransferase [unclassified Candidatus Blochmannia]URJ23333.1 50S ribosomal protein L3 N(5)-glutamine methyltransferase [Blochmannia endosymbiont of Camponotus sp. C-003]URJ28806.1 50S ribosomal protein L3 N(5)-glutamine methyltransferase [Blochmannia endosymbiont of Camponotus sp. C-046]
MKNITKETLTEIHTILDILRWSSSQFNANSIFYGHGTNNFWDETLHLILPSLYLPINIPTQIYQARLTSKERTKIIKLVNYRINKRIPVPYLTYQAWFCGLEFYVDKRVFIPRSPIGELITSYFHDLLPHYPYRILDMGTGSGCIAIAIAIVYPKSEVDAVDISMDALKVAEHNIKLYNLEHRVFPIHSDLFSNIPQSKYDLIITNPPYVNNSDIYKLPKEFHYEPVISLSADNNGLKIIQRILMNVTHHLNKNGILICEVGETKTELIKRYPNIPFFWLRLYNGGEGVFMLTYQQLLTFNETK